jgi:menaquinol-cytochrome c reductase cytochrome b/c subunit
MNEKEKQEYLENYQKAKKKGVPFFPDVLYKDAIVALLVFIVLVALAYFVGAPLEERANPADTSYTPRPEWYFLFLFQLLKYFPGSLEVVGVVVIPTLVIIGLALLPFLEGSPKRHFLHRPLKRPVETRSLPCTSATVPVAMVLPSTCLSARICITSSLRASMKACQPGMPT